MQESLGHTPVLVDEVRQLLAPDRASVILDGTVGAGGHAEALLVASQPGGTLLGLDLDPAALERAAIRLQRFGSRVHLYQASFAHTAEILEAHHPGVRLTHILLDLGLSSFALTASGRGFSFQQQDEELDMRFDPGASVPTAAEFLRRASEGEIERVLRAYGEEPLHQELARAIVKTRRERPLRTVADLVTLIEQVAGGHLHGRRTGMHPATRTFQALRICVNDELGTLAHSLPQLLALLASGGRMAVISFHSLEDRIVKTFLHREARDCVCPPSFPVCRCGHRRQLRILTKHVIQASPLERKNNPRSRSAKLRAFQKV